MGCTLILGGARSGKSDLATRLGVESARAVTFIATATAGDAEMAERIERHRRSRPEAWTTVEAPLDLSAAVTAARTGDFVIVDCLTLWVANLLGSGRSPAQIAALADESARLLAGRASAVVTNEVGLGIVPASELSRAFRDALGVVNRSFADHSERALLMVAGRALELRQT